MAPENLADTLAGFALFADLEPAQLEAITHTFEEQWFGVGQRILRQGIGGSGFHFIIEGEASVRIDGTETSRISRGDFFGELSILLGDRPSADIVALTPLRCLVLPAPELRGWLLALPQVTFRMLQAELRRLHAASRWRT